MGLPNLPTPSEGLFCYLLGNGVFPISIFKGIVRIILHIVGINLSPTSDASQNQPELFDFPESFEEIRSQTPTLRFDSVCCHKQTEVECIVCLTQFEPESEINHLCCGHMFHKVCLEKWLNYWNITCPLCRAPIMLEVQDMTPCF